LRLFKLRALSADGAIITGPQQSLLREACSVSSWLQDQRLAKCIRAKKREKYIHGSLQLGKARALLAQWSETQHFLLLCIKIVIIFWQGCRNARIFVFYLK